MRKLRNIAVIVLIVCVVATGLTLTLIDWPHSRQIDAAASPIDSTWNPVYVEDQVDTPLTKADLVTEISPVVVSIVTQTLSYNVFLQPVPQSGAASGVIIDPKGYILTNNHVVDGAETVKVTLSDGRTFDAVKWAGDSATDVAVVQIEPGGSLPYAHFVSNSLEKLKLLEEVVAVGNALALPGGPTWTGGVVSYLGRSIQESNGGVLDDLIQTDAAINPGNSGGPLVNMAGQVVGINTAIASGAENIGFAISTDTAIATVYSLVTKGAVVSAWLGVSTHTVSQSIKSYYGLSVDYGALILQVVSGSPADNAGLRADDVIVAMDDVEISDNQELATELQSHSPGERVRISFVRGEATLTTDVTLGQRSSA